MLFPQTWCFPCEQAVAYFKEQPDVEQCGPGRFRFGDCDIEVTALPDEVIDNLVLPRTKVVFLGEGEDMKLIRRRFVSRFISPFNSTRAPY